MDSLYWLVAQRQKGLLPHNVFTRGIRDSQCLVKRLANTRVLEGHHGCVNSISWNDTGSRLISGSDDCHLNIYDIPTGMVRHSFHTSHQSNIFSVKFLPLTGDYKAVSCAGIGSVEVSEITPYGEYLGHQFKCQTSITYQVATTPGCPHEFLTCEERGMVRMYDLRTCSSCHCDSDCNRSILCRFPSAVTSMAVHPLEPHYLVVGLGDGTIRLLDRRRADYWQDSGTGEPLFLGASCSLVKYHPASLQDQKLKITSVNFNHNGTEILASYSEDYVYLFNSGLYGVGPDITLTPPHIAKPRYLSQCERYSGGRQGRTKVNRKPTRVQRRMTAAETSRDTTNSSRGGDSVPSVQRTSGDEVRGHEGASPAMKRIRLRGDWSDTGPESRPESQSEPPQGPDLVNRMSRMFARWVNMSLDTVSGEEGEGGEGEGEEGEGEERERRRGSETSSDDMSLYLSSESDEMVPRDSGGDVTDSRQRGDGLQERESPEHDMDDEAVQEVIQREMHGAVQEALERAVENAVTRTVNVTASASTLRDEDDVMEDDLEHVVDGGMERNQEEMAVDGGVYNDTDTGENVTITGDGATENIAADSVEQSEEHLVERAIDDSRDDARNACTRTLSLSRDDSGETRTSPRGSQSSTSSPHAAGGVRRPLAAEVREHSSPSFPSETSPRSVMPRDQSCDRSHDHSYRRSRFKVQRRRGEGDGREDEGEGMEGRLKGQSAAEEEEEDADVNRRLMRETTRSVQNHLQPFMVYKGHRNSRTMIKQANFFGDDWVLSGSDCGRVFVWNKWTGEVVNMFTADSHVVNCIQPHPSAHMIATSGIDYNVKIWEPVATREASLSDLDEVVRRNEQMLQESRNTITIPSSFLLRILAYLNRSGRLRRSSEQQQQSPSHNESD